jgi:hypothetical protein
MGEEINILELDHKYQNNSRWDLYRSESGRRAVSKKEKSKFFAVNASNQILLKIKHIIIIINYFT